jgi:hypothetical protein
VADSKRAKSFNACTQSPLHMLGSLVGFHEEKKENKWRPLSYKTFIGMVACLLFLTEEVEKDERRRGEE